MRIDPGRVAGSTAVRRSPASGSGAAAFADRLSAGDVQARAPVAGPLPLTSLGSILAAQEVDDPLAGRRRARARGEELLDELDRLRMALLDGRLSERQLTALQKLVTERRGRSDDPRLEAVLDEIETRTAVELAKLERAIG